MKRFLKRSALVAFVVLASVSFGQAQSSGWALAVGGESDAWSGYFGPFKVHPAGIEIRYTVLCYDVVSRLKVPRDVSAFVPDGSSLAAIRTESTTAIVAGCAEYGITVPRTQVLLPASQLGQ